MRFADISGQSTAREHLVNSFESGRIAHAQLFLGPEGNAGLAMAVAYGQYLNCENRTEGDSCGVCHSCRGFAQLQHPDLRVFFPTAKLPKESGKDGKETSADYTPEFRDAYQTNPFMGLDDWVSKTGEEKRTFAIRDKDVSEIISATKHKTFESKYRCIIIWLPEYFTHGIENKLLKTIEEPPPGNIILLVAENSDRLLPTIRSRVQLLRLPAFSDEEIQAYLESSASLDSDHARNLAFLSHGNIADAIRSIGEHDTVFRDSLKELLSLSSRKNVADLVDWVDGMASEGKAVQSRFLKYMIHFFREFLMSKLTGQEPRLSESETALFRFMDSVNFSGLENMISELDHNIYYLDRNANAKILFTDQGLKLLRLLQGSKISSSNKPEYGLR